MKPLVLICSLLFSTSALAEIVGNLAVTSDYRLYGVSQTLKDPALQLVADYDFGTGLVVGTFLSNVDFVEDSEPGDLDASYEFTYYASFGFEPVKGHEIAVTVIRYTYPGTNVDLDYNELIVDYSTDLGTLTVGYSNNAFAVDETGVRYEYANGFDINDKFNVDFMLGHYDLDDVFGDSYTYYNLGLNYPVSYFNLNLSYNGTTSSGSDIFGPAADDKFAATISFDF